jgi:hypothetical protein
MTFTPLDNIDCDPDDFYADVAWYASRLFQQGLIYHEHVLGWEGEDLVLMVYAADSEALQERRQVKSAQEAFDAFVTMIGQAPAIEVSSTPTGRATVDWQDETALCVLGPTLEVGSPVYGGGSGGQIAPYRLPLPETTLSRLCVWGSHYREHFGVYLCTGSLEEAAAAELASPASQLGTEGRQFAAEIEKATGRPTYYDLFEPTEVDSDEMSRRPPLCPLCNNPWANAPEAGGALDAVSYFCEECRLVIGNEGAQAE